MDDLFDPDAELVGTGAPFVKGDPFQGSSSKNFAEASDWAETPEISDSIDAFQPAPNVLQVTMVYQYMGQIMENVFHVYRSLGWGGQDVAGIGVIFKQWQSTHLRTVQQIGCILSEVRVKDLTTATGASYVIPVPDNGGGTIAGSNEPGNVTFCISWNTSQSGRNAHGRTYHIGLCEQWVQDSIVDLNAANLILEKYNNLLPLINVNGQRLVVLSRRVNKAPRPAAVVYGILSANYKDRVTDSMRRRLPGRGR